MGFLIPDTCPSKATAGEKRLYRLFRDHLPDDFTAWYEPVVTGRYPDFVLLADTFGLLLFEVKGWLPRQVQQVSEHSVTIERTDDGVPRTEVVNNPLRQVRGYTFALIDRLKRRPELRHHGGDHDGKLVFPVGSAVAFTNIRRADADAAGWAGLLPPDQVLFRDELDALEVAGDREVRERLGRCFQHRFPFDPLSAAQMAAVRGILHPEAAVGPDARQCLDLRQEELAKSVGCGHRVFAGVAGSGKTVLLLARARWSAETDPEKRSLVLCYNRALGTALRARLAGDAGRKYEVYTFHAWARAVTRIRPYTGEPFEDYERRLVAGLLHTTANLPEPDRYDAILIDEGQDFQPDWFRCCTQALRADPPGDLMVAVDGAQSLYNRPGGFTWKSVGVNAQGRSRRLSMNYRNTREILRLAWDVTQPPAGPGGGADEEEEEPITRVSPEDAAISGPVPLFRRCRSEAEERAAVVGFVRSFLDAGLAAEEVAVLYPRQGGSRVPRLAAELRQSFDVVWLNDPENRTLKDRFPTLPGVRLVTINSAKGLEFPAVIVCGIDQLGERADEAGREGNLLYVALTRAMDRLAMTAVGSGPFVQRIAASGLAAVQV